MTVKNGRLAFAEGGRARFFGVQLLPPVAYSEPDRADALAERLARSGVNLVRLGDLDAAYGPARSLFDDTREDTQALDPVGLARLDHMVAAARAAGSTSPWNSRRPAGSGPRTTCPPCPSYPSAAAPRPCSTPGSARRC